MSNWLCELWLQAKSSIRGASTTLQTMISDIPRDQLVVITGLSGSKGARSSLATLCTIAEGRRRYVESLSAARQFLGQMDKARP